MQAGRMELIGLEAQRQYPPHGTRYATSGRIGSFWWTVPVIVAAAAGLGVAAPMLVDIFGLEDGPLWLMPKRMNGKAALFIAAFLIGGYLLCSVLPGLVAGWVVGATSVLAHTRSRIAIAVGIADAAIAGGAVVLLGAAALQERLACVAMQADPLPGHFQCMGRVLDNIGTLPGLLGFWEYLLVAAFMAATALGAVVAIRFHGHWFLYDEVAEAWYGRRVRIGPDFGLVDGGVTADALRAMPPSRAAQSEPWIEVMRHPTPNPDPARELVSAVRVFIRYDDKGKASRVAREEMPPTFVDARIVQAIVKAGAGG